MREGCREEVSGMLEASARTLSQGFLTSKECLVLKWTLSGHFISPETSRENPFISPYKPNPKSKLSGGRSSS